MKNLILIALLSLTSGIATSAHSQTFKVVPKARVAVAINSKGFRATPEHGNQRIPEDGALMHVCESMIRLGRLKTDLGVDFVYKQLTLSFDNTVYMSWDKAIQDKSFSPTQNIFVVKLEYNLKNTPFKGYMDHTCYHPIKTADKHYGGQSYGFYGGQTTIGLSWNY